MKYLATLLLIFGFGLSGFGQTIKSLGYNTTNGQVVYSGTNTLTFPTIINVEQLANSGDVAINLANRELIAGGQAVVVWGTNYFEFGQPITFAGTNAAPASRANLGFSTNLNTLWTATNASDARSAVGLGITDNVVFAEGLTNNVGIGLGSTNTGLASGGGALQGGVGIVQDGNLVARFGNTDGVRVYRQIKFDSGSAETRTNLGLGWPALTNTNASNFRDAIGLGSTNTVTFSNVVNNGNFTNNNGTIYGLKTNVGPFEGIGNFFASNNTTVGNETLFRVGVAEATNKSAQFGFRVARTNNGGEGLAVFSVFGYNALMMIGPSDRSRSNSLTNTNAAIEADIWTMSETNRVMTLRDTNTGAMVMHRPIGFNTNDSNVLTTAPANTNVTNPTGWIQIYVGTNSVRVPYYQ